VISKILGASAIFVAGVSATSPAIAAPTQVSISIPLRFGEPGVHESRRTATAAEARAERRLRIVRYGLQLADAVISAIGYRAYGRCLSCLAYPGGGPNGSSALSIGTLNGNRPAETDPLVQPFSRGGFPALALSAFAFDVVDAHIERRWSIQRRTAVDLAEIGGHVWGISTWLPEIKAIDRATAIASACGAQWQAHRFGEAFSDGCVNAYYRPGAAAPGAPPVTTVLYVCAPARFTRGTYLFSTAKDDVVASGVPCPESSSPFPQMP
jgi:hypothetical protein